MIGNSNVHLLREFPGWGADVRWSNARDGAFGFRIDMLAWDVKYLSKVLKPLYLQHLEMQVDPRP